MDPGQVSNFMDENSSGDASSCLACEGSNRPLRHCKVRCVLSRYPRLCRALNKQIHYNEKQILYLSNPL